MKKLILLAIIGILLFGGYRYISAVIDFEGFSNRIDLILNEPQSKSVDSMKNAILREAKEREIPLSMEGIAMTIEDTERRSFGERLVERPEIEVESKLLILRLSYAVKIYGISKTFSYNVDKVFTSKASLKLPPVPVFE
ncbi:MAG: hypothetical protein ACE5IH_04915 [Thermodesulfobacteriota bacterium]